MSALVDIRTLGKRYPPRTVAVADVSFQIHSGDRVAITGPSGCGKSTLLSILGLLDEPSEGQYHFDGRDVTHLNDRERTEIRRDDLSFVFQAFHLLDHLTAAENIEYSLFLRGVSAHEAAKRAAEALDLVGLVRRRTAMPKTLSGGEQQRVALARALSARPKLLLCDEPTGSLDSENTATVMDLLLTPALPGAVVIVTHDSEVAARCGRQIRMRDGRVVDS